MKKKTTNKGLIDYVKANRKGSREAEIEDHARPVSYNRVYASKKVYNRKKSKADFDKGLPYLFFKAPGSLSKAPGFPDKAPGFV